MDADAFGLEGAQRLRELVDFCSGNLGTDDAGELSAEPAHAALEPVAAVAGDAAGEHFNQTGTVGTDHGHDEIGEHGGKVSVRTQGPQSWSVDSKRTFREKLALPSVRVPRAWRAIRFARPGPFL